MMTVLDSQVLLEIILLLNLNKQVILLLEMSSQCCAYLLDLFSSPLFLSPPPPFCFNFTRSLILECQFENLNVKVGREAKSSYTIWI